ncbi:MAG: FtsQ-type POTRA domain-containing protein [Oscillospiraceae bacterium]|nr:FtsQ-type POTRA domain-containing protein [Oscillospiraceae bacterium]
MRDIEKTDMTHGANSRRIRRRKRGRSVYVLLVILLAVALIITLSMTLFFNIKEIRVTGDSAVIYDAEEIVEAVGVKRGDNMMRLHLEELEQKAGEILIDAETVDIKRQFPNTLVIDVQKSIPAFNVSYEYGTLVVSKHGKILQNSMDPMEGLVSIHGYEPEETTVGKRLSAIEERYDKIFSSFQNLIESNILETPIVSIDMSDFNDIIVNFDNRIEFAMGNWSEIDYKISFAEQVIALQPVNKEGYLTMIGSNQCSFRNKSDVQNAEKKIVSQEITETQAIEIPQENNHLT